MALVTIVWSQWLLASGILNTMNTSVNPCDDFFQFACGNYSNQVTLPDAEATMNSFVEADKTLRRQLKLMFQTPSNSTDSKIHDMVKKYYKACMDEPTLEKLGLQPMKDMISKYGGWPMVEGSKWNGDNYQWLNMAARTYRDLGLSRILLVTVKDDYMNTSKRILEVDQPKLGLGKRDYYLNDNYSDILNAYRKFIYSTAIQLGADEATAKRDTDAVIDFEIKLANITVPSEKRRNFTELYNPMKIGAMKEKFPKILFDIWLKSMSNNGWPIDDNQIVDVPGDPYMNLLPDILAQTDIRTIANYQLIAPILSMVSYLAPSLRENYREYRTALYGSKVFKPRWEECVLVVRDDLDWQVSSMYVKEYFKANSKEEVEEIVSYLKEAMKNVIKDAPWMDDETKSRGQEKLQQVAQKIGYPDYIFNETRILEDFYGVEIDEMRYFDSGLSLSKTAFNKDKRTLREFHNRSEWDRGPAVVNAFYWPEQNSITFPAGILQRPFFVVNAPRYMNYARIGSVIGHEITHGYDDQGRQFDGQGSLHLWWSNETLDKYKIGTKCFVDQYATIRDEATGLNLNGELEVGENIADNGGIKLAYKAYQTWKSRQTFREPSLPDLTNYSIDQMFFIAYAQQWCDVIRPAFRSRLIITDPHAPNEYRVNVPLQNFPAFSEAYQCVKGSRMNPNEKCVIW